MTRAHTSIARTLKSEILLQKGAHQVVKNLFTETADIFGYCSIKCLMGEAGMAGKLTLLISMLLMGRLLRATSMPNIKSAILLVRAIRFNSSKTTRRTKIKFGTVDYYSELSVVRVFVTSR